MDFRRGIHLHSWAAHLEIKSLISDACLAHPQNQISRHYFSDPKKWMWRYINKMSVLVFLLPNCIIKHGSGSVMWLFMLRGWVTVYIIGFEAQRSGDILNRRRSVSKNKTGTSQECVYRSNLWPQSGSQIFRCCTDQPKRDFTAKKRQ